MLGRRMTRRLASTTLAAVLAIYAGASADIQRHELGAEVEVRLVLAKGEPTRCAVRAWSGVGIEGSCGSIRWEELKSGTAFRLLKELVAVRGGEGGAAAKPSEGTESGGNAKQGEVATTSSPRTQDIEDAAAVAMSLAEPGAGESVVLGWARKAGVDAAGESRIRAEADRLRAERESRLRAERDAAQVRRTPEAAAFPRQAWIVAPPGDFDVDSRSALEAARALLARAGGSATLYETKWLSVLAESGDDAVRNEAGALEAATADWHTRFEVAGLPLRQQARIPVVFVADLDRWRLLVTAAFGGDPAVHRESFTVYPEGRAVVFVAPDGDVQRRRFAAFVGVARALLHYTGSPARPTPWINEGLPLAMADISVPAAARDRELRRAGLAHLRKGGSFAPILRAVYGDSVWTRDLALSRSLSYMLVRHLLERNVDAALLFAKGDLPGAADDDARFRKSFGEPIANGVASAQRWFQTND